MQFLGFYINFVFVIWLLLLRITTFIFIYAGMCISTPSRFPDDLYSSTWTYHYLLNHLPVVVYLLCFHSQSYQSHLYFFCMWIYVFIFLDKYWEVEWLGYIFNFWTYSSSVFQSSCVILHSYIQWMRAPDPPHGCQHLVCSVSLMLATLLGVCTLTTLFSKCSYT